MAIDRKTKKAKAKSRAGVAKNRPKSVAAGTRAAARGKITRRKVRPEKSPPGTTAGAATDEVSLQSVLEQIRPEFLEEGARRISHDDVAVVIEESAKILRKFRRGESLGQYTDDVTQLLALIGDYWTGAYTRVPYWTIALATFALLYVLKPVDIIPDVLPGIGELDDALVISFSLALTRAERQSYRLWVLARELDVD